MKVDNKLTKPAKEMLGQEIAPTGRDWHFFNSLSAMPNPDPILRRIGKAQEVYNSILADAHVTGEVRSIRGSFRSHFYRVNVGDDQDKRAQDARDLCEHWLQHSRPNTVAQDWMEVMWQMCSAIFTGYKVHEVIWDVVDGLYLPITVKDRANNRFRFDTQGELLLLKPDTPQGASVEPYQFVVSRHMATCDNPYGEALLSRCFWPWTFKTGGFKYFVQYCEKFGVPVPFGEYPQGSSVSDVDKYEQSLANLLNNHYIVAPAGSKIQLLTPTGGGSLPQESLIKMCNSEMGKALNSQSMTAELSNVGARAASQIAAERQTTVNNADRDIAAGSIGEIFRWITLFNFGADVASPTLEFYTEEQASIDRANAYKIAAELGAKPSKRALLEELNIPMAADEADAIVSTPAPSSQNTLELGNAGNGTASFSEPSSFSGNTSAAIERTISQAKAQINLETAAIEAIDEQFAADVIQPFADMLGEFESSGKTLAEFKESLGAFLGGVDTESIRVLTEQALTLSALQGAYSSVLDVQDAQKLQDSEFQDANP